MTEKTSISFLNVGTKILLRDIMDQFIRAWGDHKTYYAPTMKSAMRMFSQDEIPIHVVISEVNFEDGSAFKLFQSIEDLRVGDELYVILALEESSQALLALSAELEAHSVLIKPFAATDLKAQIEQYKVWRTRPKEPWRGLLKKSALFVREKKFRDGEQCLKEAIDSSPENPVLLFKVGVYYLNKMELGVAESMLKKAIELRPNYCQALSALAVLYLHSGELDRSDKLFRQAYLLSPLNPDRLVDVSKLHLKRCIEVCKESLRIDPNGLAARFNLGKAYAVQKDYLGAVRELESVLPHLAGPAKAEAQTFLALVRKLGSLAK